MRIDIVSKILRTVAILIESADERRLEAALIALKSVSVDNAINSKKVPVKNRHQKVDIVELQNLLEGLNKLGSREEGYDFLNKRDLSRKELERLARLRKVYVTKNDDMAKIKEKIVELIIGAKLNSRAIRGD